MTQFNLGNANYTPDEIWGRFVGDQSTAEFLSVQRDAIVERGLRSVVQDYVDGTVHDATCGQYDVYNYREAGVFRHAIAAGLIAHITAQTAVQ